MQPGLQVVQAMGEWARCTPTVHDAMRRKQRTLEPTAAFHECHRLCQYRLLAKEDACEVRDRISGAMPRARPACLGTKAEFWRVEGMIIGA